MSVAETVQDPKGAVYNYRSINGEPMTDAQMRVYAPSVFATEPYEAMSDRYRYIPTNVVVDALRDARFMPVSVQQSRTRNSEKRGYTKHLINFRKQFQEGDLNNGDFIPEITLFNSHDGSSGYQMGMAAFRVECANGLIVSKGFMDFISVRHSGKSDLCQNVINASNQIIENAPLLEKTVNDWKSIVVNEKDKTEYADYALGIYDSNLNINPLDILKPRRGEDCRNDLWTVFNVVQENLMRGSVAGYTTTNRMFKTREVKSVDRTVKLNRELWDLTADLAANYHNN